MVGVDLEGPVDQNLLFDFRVAAAGQCIDACDQFSRSCRFGDIVVGAGIQGTNDVGFTVTLGQETAGTGQFSCARMFSSTSIPVMSGICQSRMIRS